MLNTTNIEKKIEQLINFPAPNDKIWETIDKELEKLIPQHFHKQLMHRLSTSEISKQFDTWLHKYFLDRFGKKEPKEFHSNSRKPKQHKALTMLRKRKKQCKAARKALIKAGMKGSPEEKRMVFSHTPTQQIEDSSSKAPANQRPN